MRYLIASDIHGALPAAEMLVARFREEGADRLLLLGDLLYHGPRNPLPEGYAPAQVAKLLNGLADRITAVRGNCDSEVDQMVLNFPCLGDYALVVDERTTLLLTHGHLDLAAAARNAAAITKTLYRVGPAKASRIIPNLGWKNRRKPLTSKEKDDILIERSEDSRWRHAVNPAEDGIN